MKHPKRAVDRDGNEDAAEVVRRTTAQPDPIPEGLEAAWVAWSKRIYGVDERTLTLLRAAFEAGAEAGPKARSRAGGLKGGKTRAERLSATQRQEVARTAAKARWKKP